MNTISDDVEAVLARMMDRAADAQQVQQGKPRSEHKPFTLDGVAECVVEAHGAAKAFALDAMERKPGYWLTLAGRPGCGKTHLLDNVRHALLERGVEVQRWRWKRVLDALREGKDDLLFHLAGLRVLLLDDVGAENLGTERALGFSLSTLCELMELRAGKFTMLTSNLLPRDFAAADQRAASRLVRNGGKVVNLADAGDFSALAYGAARGKK